MELLLQRIIDGVGDGMIYGAIALALVLIYRVTGLVNFAQGEMAMFATFIVWWITRPDRFLGFIGDPQLRMAVGIFLGLGIGFVIGVVCERFIMRPFEKRPYIDQAMVTMGMYLGLSALAAYIFSVQPVAMESVFSAGGIPLGGANLTWSTIGLIVVFTSLSLLLRLLFTRTRFGLAMRATTNNAVSAQLSGINVKRTLMLGWGLASAVGGVAGAMLAPKLFLSPFMMQSVLLYAFAAAILGGLDSVPGAIVGGILVGLTQHLAGGYLFGSELALAAALLLILIVLLVRPQGLFGKVKVERV
ncbi:branched-chain amino acid ABC transporter permease [Amycolatopsis sp. GM8]|uniref:branched-chain amino acid ABC transporter permease n=1 Tax=Amycolatopsis sp. GM8 TaxID=2896530 RepID=UPI001F192C2D|nr:branched-chain amino acid ABC transporter permease [Amycolatopsis sp. GM8]